MSWRSITVGALLLDATVITINISLQNRYHPTFLNQMLGEQVILSSYCLYVEYIG